MNPGEVKILQSIERNIDSTDPLNEFNLEKIASKKIYCNDSVRKTQFDVTLSFVNLFIHIDNVRKFTITAIVSLNESVRGKMEVYDM